MTRKELVYGGYRAIAVEACGKDLDQPNLYRSYLCKLRTSPARKHDNEASLRLGTRPIAGKECEYPSHHCSLFAVNGGKGMPLPVSGSVSPGSEDLKHENIAHYAFVIVSDGCRHMNECVTRLEDELRLREERSFFGYSDEEIQWLIDSRLR